MRRRPGGVRVGGVVVHCSLPEVFSVSIYILSVNNDRKFNSSRITINRTAVDVAVCEPKVISSYVANIVNMGC